MSSTFYIALIVGIAYVLHLRRKRLPANTRLPPGPPTDPLIGHLRSFPMKDQPETFHGWSKQYGDVVHLEVLGRDFIILGSEKAALDLLEKRGANYSDRPHSEMHDLIGWADMLVFLNYGEQFTKIRRLSQQPFNRKESENFREIQMRQTHTLLHQFLQTPDKYYTHTLRFATAAMMEIAYGHRVVSDNDAYLSLIDEGIRVILESGNIGMSILDIFPVLKHLPAWFPGAWFIRFAAESRGFVHKAREWPFQEVQRDMAAGTVRKSFLSDHLENFAQGGIDSPQEFADLKTAALLLNQAGGETTSSAVLLFLFAILLNPEAQEKAQKEIDSVIGTTRLPNFSDRESLPFVECLIQETFRCYQPLPLGIPHCSRKDDVYNGMFIPKGSIIFYNSMTMSFDEKVYANPHKFWPERYLQKPLGNGEPRPALMYGFGRRICPGRYLADSALWLVIVSVLAVFKISYAQDEQGNDVIPPTEYNTSTTRRPKPFPCRIQARGPWVEKLIRDAYDETLRA